MYLGGEMNAVLPQILATATQPVKIDLNKKSLPMQKTIQNFTIDAQGFRGKKMKSLPFGYF